MRIGTSPAPTETVADQVAGSSPSTNDTRSRTAQATASAINAGSRGSRTEEPRPHCSISIERRGSASARCASTHRTQAVTPGTTNGPRPTASAPPWTRRWGTPERTAWSSRSRATTASPITSSTAGVAPAAVRSPESCSRRVAAPARSAGPSTATGAAARRSSTPGARDPWAPKTAATAGRSAAGRAGRRARRRRRAGHARGARPAPDGLPACRASAGRRGGAPRAAAGPRARRAPRPGAAGRCRPAGAGRRGVRRTARAAGWAGRGERGRLPRTCPAP